MDPISQGLLGGIVTQSASKENSELRFVTILGILAGLLPDIDVLIKSQTDSLLTIEYHRHFTHAIAFAPIGGAFVAFIFWLFFRKRYTFSKLWGYSTLGYITGGLLDACTSYGTQLYLPFSSYREGWNIISIVDPIFTTLLLIGVVLAFLRKNPKPARLFLSLCFLYLSVGFIQRTRAENFASELASSRGHRVQRLKVHPSIGNLLVWRLTYESENNFYADAVRLGIFREPILYAGGSAKKFSQVDTFPELDSNSRLSKDIARFQHFSQGWIFKHPKNHLILGDFRYSMVPNGVNPLWGIKIFPNTPDMHAKFTGFRRARSQEWEVFKKMLRGQTLE